MNEEELKDLTYDPISQEYRWDDGTLAPEFLPIYDSLGRKIGIQSKYGVYYTGEEPINVM